MTITSDVYTKRDQFANSLADVCIIALKEQGWVPGDGTMDALRELFKDHINLD